MILFFTRAQLESRMGSRKIKRLLDDNQDGLADTDAVNQLRADASSKVRSYIEPMGVMPTIEALFNQTSGELLNGKKLPDELVRLALDVAVALAAQRHPEVMRQDWRQLMEQVDKDLCKLRDGKTSLGGGTQGGVATPESQVQGGTVVIADDGSGTEEDERVARWSEMGDFG